MPVRLLRPLIVLFAAGYVLAACTTLEDRVAEWVGEPVTDYIEAMYKPDTYASKTGWKDQRYDLRNGNWVLVAPRGEGCLVHYEVDQRGVIVNYRLDGAQCW